MEVTFDMQINVKVSTSWYYPSGQMCSKYPKEEVGNIFARY